MCSVVKGDEPLKITWHLQGAVVSSEPSLTTTMLGTRSSILTITDVGYRHAGVYACKAQNPAGAVTYSAQLRVKGMAGIRSNLEHREVTAGFGFPHILFNDICVLCIVQCSDGRSRM